MEIQHISKKLVSGIISLTFRRAVLLAINFITINLILARFLPVSVIGTFNIANTILAFFTFFSDIGLAAAIIQKKEVKDQDLKTTFVIQESLALAIFIIVFFLAPTLASIYKIDLDGIWLIRALAFGFLLTSLKVIPSVLLERELRFTPLVWVEILETVIFNSILIPLSFMNYGLEAFSVSVIARGLVGVFAIYIIAPWKIGFELSKESVKSLFSFGIPFQLNSILALFKDRLVPLVVAGIVGPLGNGYITWAQSIAFLPLEIMNIIIRVTFPAFSRLQDDKEALKQTVEKSLFISGLFLYPMLFGVLAITPSLVSHIVSDKWQPAIPLIYLFAVNTFWASLSTMFTNVLNAIGKIKITLYLMIIWTILTWVLSPALALTYGFIGVGIASAAISFTSIIPVILIKRIINVEVIKSIWQPILAALLMSGVTYFMTSVFTKDLLSLLGVIIVSGLIYCGLIIILAKDKINKYIDEFKKVSP